MKASEAESTSPLKPAQPLERPRAAEPAYPKQTEREYETAARRPKSSSSSKRSPPEKPANSTRSRESSPGKWHPKLAELEGSYPPNYLPATSLSNDPPLQLLTGNVSDGAPKRISLSRRQISLAQPALPSTASNKLPERPGHLLLGISAPVALSGVSSEMIQSAESKGKLTASKLSAPRLSAPTSSAPPLSPAAMDKHQQLDADHQIFELEGDFPPTNEKPAENPPPQDTARQQPILESPQISPVEYSSDELSDVPSDYSTAPSSPTSPSPTFPAEEFNREPNEPSLSGVPGSFLGIDPPQKSTATVASLQSPKNGDEPLQILPSDETSIPSSDVSTEAVSAGFENSPAGVVALQSPESADKPEQTLPSDETPILSLGVQPESVSADLGDKPNTPASLEPSENSAVLQSQKLDSGDYGLLGLLPSTSSTESSIRPEEPAVHHPEDTLSIAETSTPSSDVPTEAVSASLGDKPTTPASSEPPTVLQNQKLDSGDHELPGRFSSTGSPESSIRPEEPVVHQSKETASTAEAPSKAPTSSVPSAFSSTIPAVVLTGPEPDDKPQSIPLPQDSSVLLPTTPTKSVDSDARSTLPATSSSPVLSIATPPELPTLVFTGPEPNAEPEVISLDSVPDVDEREYSSKIPVTWRPLEKPAPLPPVAPYTKHPIVVDETVNAPLPSEQVDSRHTSQSAASSRTAPLDESPLEHIPEPGDAIERKIPDAVQKSKNFDNSRSYSMKLIESTSFPNSRSQRRP